MRPLCPVRPAPAGAAHARQGGDTPAKVCFFASLPFTARTATAGGGALASRYGSDLLSLKLPWPCSQAAPFVALPEFRRFPALCQARFPPRSDNSPLRVSSANGNLLARWSRRALWHVLVRSSNSGPVRSLRFLRESKLTADSDSASVRFLIAASFEVSSSHFRQSATSAVETRESCPGLRLDGAALAREPGAPTAPDCFPVARDYLRVTGVRF